jgi:hypothetical protein
MHRSGGTLLSRLLNCHPDLVIWGEHGAFIKGLAESYELLLKHRALMRHHAELIDQHIQFTPEAQAKFYPWLSPFGPEDFLAHCQSLLTDLFARDIWPRQRWGFKEIRYHDPMVLEFLSAAFPQSQSVIQIRDPIELCVSNILVPWSMTKLELSGADKDQVEFERLVRDCLYAILVMQTNLQREADRRPERTLVVHYEKFGDAAATQTDRLFEFLGLRLTADVRQSLAHVLSSVAGATELKSAASNTTSLLNPAAIREAAASLLPEIKEELARTGPDLARLKGLQSDRGYCFLLGDQELLDSPLSSIF